MTGGGNWNASERLKGAFDQANLQNLNSLFGVEWGSIRRLISRLLAANKPTA